MDTSAPRGAADAPAAPVRTCVGCRTRDAQNLLVRIAALEGRIEPDPDRRIPGRGAYLHPREQCIALALRRRPWARAFRTTGTLQDAPIRQWSQHLASLPVPASAG